MNTSLPLRYLNDQSIEIGIDEAGRGPMFGRVYAAAVVLPPEDSEFKFELIPMSFVFALLGGIVGLLFGLYHIRLSGQKNLVRYLEHELAEELPLLIARGESEHLEFKLQTQQRCES